MKYNNTLALIPALLLAACGGDEQTMNEKVSSEIEAPQGGILTIKTAAEIPVRKGEVIASIATRQDG